MQQERGNAPAMVFLDRTGRRRRVLRLALIALSAAWVVLVVLIVIGLTSPGGAPATKVAAASRHHQAPATISASPPAKPATAHQAATTRQVPAARLSSMSRKFPAACTTRRASCTGRGCRKLKGLAVAHGLDSVRAAYDSDGVAPAGRPWAGNFDCRGFSFSAQPLAADGFGPGERVAADGVTLTLPRLSTGEPDEITAQGQKIMMHAVQAPHGVLGVLGAGEFGTQHGVVTVTYANGTRSRARLSLADWYADSPARGTVIAASAPWNVPAKHRKAFGLDPVSVYYAQLKVHPDEPITSLALPGNAELHIFDIGVPAPARYASQAPARDDTGVATPAHARDANFDGAGHSYDAAALAAAGLRSGGRVTAQGVTFTWPGGAAGHFDNIRAEGQTIGVSGNGWVLGFLGAGVLSRQSAQVTIHYTDGSSQRATITFASWRSRRAASGGTVVARVPWNRTAGVAPHQVAVFSATVPLETGKKVASVTLPTDFRLHIFAIAEGK